MLRRAACFLVVTLVGCGARSALQVDPSGGGNGEGGAGGQAPEPCEGIVEQVCGSDVGECAPGLKHCQPDGFFGPCEGGIEPVDELCNGLDDDCDGAIDNGFGIGEACDGPDGDFCFDDVMTCNGCSEGPDVLEVCNGVDDNCNGTIDADCDVGGCSPTLLVTGSVPSDPGCVDLPVEAGSTGVINYPCEGGPVSATLGGIEFTGTVMNGQVFLSGTVQVIGPDGCLWQLDHFITGSIPAGTVEYSYQETLLTSPPNDCWFPCTETGTVDIDWGGP